jgi:hypothetical protein
LLKHKDSQASKMRPKWSGLATAYARQGHGYPVEGIA